MTADSITQPLVQWPHAGGEMADLIRAHGWSTTSLGPIEFWPPSLRMSVDLMLGCAFPATLQWGAQLNLFYNDAYIPLIGSKHPSALGKPILESFPEIGDSYKPMVERVWQGESIVLRNQHFRYIRHQDPEDLWFDLSFSPIHAEDGSIGGLLAIGLDVTPRFIAEQAREDTERRLRRVLETETVGVIFFDYGGTVIDANDVFLRITGYSREEIQNRSLTWRTMTPPEWIPASEVEMEKLFRTGRIGPYETEHLLKDGSRRHMLIAGRDLGDGTIAKFCIDVTERRAAEVALQTSEQRFRAMVEATSDMIFRANPDWTEMRELRGQNVLADTDAPDKTWMDKYIHPDDHAALQIVLQESIRNKTIFQLEHRVVRADGTIGWSFSRAVPLLNTAGEIKEWFGASSDITVRKMAEDSLMRSEKLATLGRLAASIAHEINNPLEAMTNLLYLIKTSDGLSEQVEHTVDVAETELKRIAHITRLSLGFYREANAPTHTSVTELLDEAIDLLKGKIRSRSARIERRWMQDIVITAVPGELRQIFSNLLANSLDAIESGGCVTIRARAALSLVQPRLKGVRVTFADNGKGIRNAIRSSIFDPFYTTKDGTGTGLGLWVTRQIVEKYEGQIRMRTRSEGPKTGTVFTVFLPDRHAKISGMPPDSLRP